MSSAVADERTATVAFGDLAAKRSYAVLISRSSAEGSGAEAIQPRISAPVFASLVTLSTSSAVRA